MLRRRLCGRSPWSAPDRPHHASAPARHHRSCVRSAPGSPAALLGIWHLIEHDPQATESGRRSWANGRWPGDRRHQGVSGFPALQLVRIDSQAAAEPRRLQLTTGNRPVDGAARESANAGDFLWREHLWRVVVELLRSHQRFESALRRVALVTSIWPQFLAGFDARQNSAGRRSRNPSRRRGPAPAGAPAQPGLAASDAGATIGLREASAVRAEGQNITIGSRRGRYAAPRS
jgi:hypothetical protein